MTKLLKILSAIPLLVFSAQLHASMMVNKAIVNFPVGTNRQDVEVYNPDAEPLYVKVEVLEVTNPGMENEKRMVVHNPKDSGFLVTPKKLLVTPGARKTVRLVNMAPPGKTDRVFRVNLVPVAAEVESDVNAIKVVVGYQLLALIQPVKPFSKIIAERKGKRLVLKNAGNTNVMFRLGSQCPTADTPKQECEELSGKRLYAGQVWALDLKYDSPVEFMTTVGDENEKVVYP